MTKFFTPENKLKQKAGSGGIPDYRLKKCQEYLDGNDLDFSPYAKRDLRLIADILADIRNGGETGASALTRIATLVTQMKANGTMFHYPLIAALSHILLDLMGRVRGADRDFLDIMDVYIRVMGVIAEKRMRGASASGGDALKKELSDACARYRARHDST